MKYHHNDRQYTTRDGARAAARRLLKKTGGIFEIEGVAYAWNMDNVVVYPENRAWTVFFELDAREDAMAEVEVQERLDMKDEAYFERIASEDKEEAQEEAPRELTVEQALEIAAQQTGAVDEEFRAVEARHRTEAMASVSPRQEDLAQLMNPSAKQPEPPDETFQRMLDFNQSDIDVATDVGLDALETAISRMVDALHGLKRHLEDYDNAPRDEAHSKGDYLAWAANDLRNADFNDLRLVLAEQAGKLKALGTARVHIKHFCEK